jgi:membrane associated rhomboid family serine protease
LTLGPNSSILSLGLCHFGHTNVLAFLFNSAVLWTVGNYHAKKYGCARFAKLLGLSGVIASAIGVY